jgi:chloramphenicol O-acetyltransferase type A
VRHPCDAPVSLARWPRRAVFEAFSGFAHPHVGCCVMLDAAALRARTRARGDSFALACHFLALRLAQQQEPMRLRLRGRQPRLLHQVHGSTTVLRPDGSFGFAVLLQCADWPAFQAQGRQAMDAARQAPAGQALREPERALERSLMHFTTVPWLHFTHFSHPRRGRSDASIPKLAFGGWREDGARLWLPVSLEVHHALMDGLHMGQYLQALQAAMHEPAAWLGA